MAGGRSRSRAAARQRRGDRLALGVLVAPALLLLCTFIYAPAASNVWYSLLQWSSISTHALFVGSANYVELFTTPLFWSALANNVWYAAISVAVQVFVALAIAATLESGIFPRSLSAFFRIVLFIPSILPVTAIGALWKMLLAPTMGLVDQLMTASGLDAYSHAWLGEEGTALFSVILVSQWQWTGYMVVLFIVAIRAVPGVLYEAMGIDGGGGLRQFWHITLPGVRETTLVMVAITVFGAFQVFDIVWVMTAGGPSNSSEVLGTLMYRAAFRNDTVGLASAIATVIFVLTFAVGIVQIRLQRDE